MSVAKTHPVLRIPELLDTIFSSLDKSDNTVNARVCKAWSDVALDSLWYEIDDLAQLFQILGSLYAKPSTEIDPRDSKATFYWFFHRTPLPDDWKRFESYGRRVRRLILREQHTKTYQFNSVFDDIARTRPWLDILPSLQKLGWDEYTEHALMFMHPHVKHFIVFLSPPNTSKISMIPDITSRMPNLTTLDIRPKGHYANIQNDMLALIQGLPRLRKIVFARFFASTIMVEELTKAQDLTSIEFQYSNDPHSFGEFDTVLDFSPELREGAFPALKELCLTASYECMIRFFKSPHAPLNLTEMYIHDDQWETPTNIQLAIELFSSTLPKMETLTLVSYMDFNVAPLPADGKAPRVTYQTIKSLLNFPVLKSFEILHHYPVDISQEELEELASSWPKLKHFMLNNEPAYPLPAHCTLTLDAFLPFAKHCPDLVCLGLYINAESIPRLPSLSGVDVSFKQPLLLSMGLSSIAEAGSVALYLSELSSHNDSGNSDVIIESGVTWDQGYSPDEESPPFQEELMVWCSAWNKVGELLPLLVRLRWEERQKKRELVKEVEDLRMRCSVLEERAKMQSESRISLLKMLPFHVP